MAEADTPAPAKSLADLQAQLETLEKQVGLAAKVDSLEKQVAELMAERKFLARLIKITSGAVLIIALFFGVTSRLAIPAAAAHAAEKVTESDVFAAAKRESVASLQNEKAKLSSELQYEAHALVPQQQWTSDLVKLKGWIQMTQEKVETFAARHAHDVGPQGNNSANSAAYQAIADALNGYRKALNYPSTQPVVPDVPDK